MEDSMSQEIQVIEDILEKYVRPGLNEHGGDIEADSIKNGVLYVKLKGCCSGCPSAKYTIESLVKENILKHTTLINDVRLSEEVSQELYDFAKKILLEKGRCLC